MPIQSCGEHLIEGGMDNSGISKNQCDGEDRMPLKATSWSIAFSQACNMRCNYCYTCHGTLGQRASIMKPSVWKPLGKRIVESVEPGQNVSTSFGCGETFLHFDEFMCLVEYLESLARDRKVGLSIHVSTNGLALDEERLMRLAQHRISLAFSIDGPAHIHDRCRKDIDGNPTHQRIMDNWKIYRELSLNLPKPPSCNVQSVIHDHSRLKDVAEYWFEQGVPIIDTAIQGPLPAYMNRSFDGWQTRRDDYLEDFKTLAMAAAKRMNVPTFLSDYAGPSMLLFHWRDLFLRKPKGSCGAGIRMLAVDAHGNLYPCDGFIAYPKWITGTVSKGINRDHVLDFQHKRRELIVTCETCEANVLCTKGCCASSPDTDLVLNSDGGCDFMKKIVNISQESYELLKKKT